jgi:signal transduction histidine kinase
MTSYLGEDLMPEWASKQLVSLKSGDYEKQNDKQNYYIAIRDLPDGQRFYLFFNVTTLLNDHSTINIIREYLMITLLPAFIIGLLLGVMTAYKAVSPVVRLTKMVKSKDETGFLPKDMSKKFENDEVGFLASTLEHAIVEMQSAIDREKAFARDASHELRTPLTVMQGAIRILTDDIRDDDFKKLNLLSRLKRATMNMEHLINSFLWLSRQERRDTNGSSRASEVIRECIDNNGYLMRNKDITITVNEYDASALPVTPEILTIIIGNLIRNAMTYTQKGEIIISIHGECISVKDSGPGIPQHVLENINVVGGVSKADGFGFGLSIAHRMCSQLGWKLRILSKEGEGTNIIVCCINKNAGEVKCPGICKLESADGGAL